jgi:hypothetical protein
MAAQVEQLDLESTLMLYAADELPAAERSAMDARLAAEPALASRLELLCSSRRICFDALERDDQQDRLPTSQGVAVRRVARAMRQWQVDRLVARPSAPAAPRRLRIPGWTYPTAAAMILIGFLVWSVRQPVNAVMPPSDKFSAYVEAQQTDLADWMTDSLRSGSRDDFRSDTEFYAVSSNPNDQAVNSDLDAIFLRDDSEQ